MPSARSPLSRAAVLTSAGVLAVAGVSAAPGTAAGSFSLITAQTDTGTYPVRWNPCQSAITVKVNTKLALQRGVSASRARATAGADVTTAVRTMADETGIPFTITGDTDHIPTGGNWAAKQNAQSEIVIAFADSRKAGGRSSLLTGDELGQGGQVYAYDGPTVVAGRGFVVINAVKAAKIKPGFGRGVTRGNLLLHELAHVMGLRHTTDRSQLLFPTLHGGTPAGFAAGDSAGLDTIDANAGCIADAGEFWPGS